MTYLILGILVAVVCIYTFLVIWTYGGYIEKDLALLFLSSSLPLYKFYKSHLFGDIAYTEKSEKYIYKVDSALAKYRIAGEGLIPRFSEAEKMLDKWFEENGK